MGRGQGRPRRSDLRDQIHVHPAARARRAHRRHRSTACPPSRARRLTALLRVRPTGMRRIALMVVLAGVALSAQDTAERLIERLRTESAPHTMVGFILTLGSYND